MERDKIRDIIFCLNGSAVSSDHEIIENTFKQLEADPAFSPEFINKRGGKKFDPYSWELLNGERLQHFLEWGTTVARRKTVQYTCDVNVKHEPCMSFRFKRSTSNKNIEKLFQWSDSVVNAYQPDAATLTVVPQLPNERCEESIKLDQAFSAGFLLPNTYPKYGPKLGMCTWLSQLHVDAIGLQNLKATPLMTVDENDRGGVKLMLGESRCPWEMDVQTWVDTWHTAMDHLRTFHVFAYPVVKGSKVKVYRGRNCLTPRPDGLVLDTSSYLAPEDLGKQATIKSAPIEELIELFLNGKEEKSVGAFRNLLDKAYAQTDLAAHLPDPATIKDTELQIRVVNLLLLSHINQNRFDDFLAVSKFHPLESRMLQWGSRVAKRAPQFISRLMPIVIEELSNSDPQRVKQAGNLITVWGKVQTAELWSYSNQLIPLLSADAGIVSGLAEAFLVSKDVPSVEAVSAQLDSNDSKLRKGAAQLLARIAIGQGQLVDLLPLVSSANSSVRSGVSIEITDYLKNSKGDVHGKDFMAAAVLLTDRRGRETIANAVTKGMESRFKLTPEIKAAKKLLESNNAEDRASGAEVAGRLIGDLHDCRMLATLVAQALFDEAELVRDAAAEAMGAIVEFQAPVHVVQTTLPCIDTALKHADGDAKSSLEYALENISCH